MLVLQTTPFTKSTAVPMSTFQMPLNDMDALIPLLEAPFIHKASDGFSKPRKAQTWWLEIEMQPAESPAAQPPGRFHEVVENAPATAPADPMSPPSRPKLRAQHKTPPPCSFNSS